MRYAPFWILLFSMFLTANACRKDVEEVRPYPVTVEELNLFLKQVPDASTTTTFQFSGLSDDKILILPGGARIFLTDVDQLFYSTTTTSPVLCSSCSDLEIVVTLANSKGDILGRGLPTISPENKLLESHGMIEITVSCGGTPLKLLPGRNIKVQLPASNTQDGFSVHEAEFNAGNFVGWQNSGQEIFIADWPDGFGNSISGYELLISNLGWASCARPVSGTGNQFCTSLLPNFTGLNTKAYLVFDGIRAVAPLIFDDATHSFCFPEIPAGYPVRIVTVGKFGSDFWYGQTNTETGTNPTVLPLQPEKEDAVEILGYLRGL
ncbi:MAG: hypothetical protein JNJ57_10575 [Saprospiraceae bacterium]|nr:hypothetical protein [Saprospiraceae bacterium]